MWGWRRAARPFQEHSFLKITLAPNWMRWRGRTDLGMPLAWVTRWR